MLERCNRIGSPQVTDGKVFTVAAEGVLVIVSGGATGFTMTVSTGGGSGGGGGGSKSSSGIVLSSICSVVFSGTSTGAAK